LLLNTLIFYTLINFLKKHYIKNETVKTRVSCSDYLMLRRFLKNYRLPFRRLPGENERVAAKTISMSSYAGKLLRLKLQSELDRKKINYERYKW